MIMCNSRDSCIFWINRTAFSLGWAAFPSNCHSWYKAKLGWLQRNKSLLELYLNVLWNFLEICWKLFIWICGHPVIAVCTLILYTYGMGNVDLYSAVITKVSNALNTLVSGEKPGFQALSKGLVVLLCVEVVRQRVPDHGAVHSECSASNSG